MSALAPPREEVRRSPLRSLNPLGTTVVVLAAALVAWIVTVERMRGMDAGPGTSLGDLGWYVGIWVTMTAAMMLPSVAPMALLFARVSRDRRGRGEAFVPTWIFLAGYLASWTAYGLLAYGVFRLVTAGGTDWLAWDRAGPYIAGGAVLLAGLYQLTPLKEVCLRHCRGPMHFILHGWRTGPLGALRMGGEHGIYCIGCCWGLMVILFAVGVMSLFWMVVVAAVIFVEKVLPQGLRFSQAFALGFVALGLWIAIAPGSVPGLTQPNSDKAQQARNRMPGMQMPGSPKPMNRMP
jgi:predicted metal-binding membrane protein